MRVARLLTVLVLGLACGRGDGARADEATGFDFVDPRVVEMDPIDRKVSAPAKVVVSGRLGEGYGAPAVIVIRPDGRAVLAKNLTWNQPMALEDERGGTFRADVELASGRGTYRLEVRATTQGDLTHSGARWRVFSGVPLDSPDDPEPPDVPPDASVPELVLEARFFGLVNAHRKRARLEPFEWLEPLAMAARDHAKACAKKGVLDHRVDGDGNVAQRLMRKANWGDISYALPPGRPSPGLGRTSYVTASTDARKSLDLVLYRWQRFAAFCLPMTSEDLTHAACAVARSPSGDLYVVFVYAQLNAPRMLEQVEQWPAAIGKEVAAASGADRARLLREWAQWRTSAARTEVRRRLADPDPEIRAAAHDGMLLIDEADERASLERAMAALRDGVAVPARAEAVRATARWMSHLALAPDLANEAAAVLAALPDAKPPGSPPEGR